MSGVGALRRRVRGIRGPPGSVDAPTCSRRTTSPRPSTPPASSRRARGRARGGAASARARGGVELRVDYERRARAPSFDVGELERLGMSNISTHRTRRAATQASLVAVKADDRARARWCTLTMRPAIGLGQSFASAVLVCASAPWRGRASDACSSGAAVPHRSHVQSAARGGKSPGRSISGGGSDRPNSEAYAHFWRRSFGSARCQPAEACAVGEHPRLVVRLVARRRLPAAIVEQVGAGGDAHRQSAEVERVGADPLRVEAVRRAKGGDFPHELVAAAPARQCQPADRDEPEADAVLGAVSVELFDAHLPWRSTVSSSSSVTSGRPSYQTGPV